MNVSKVQKLFMAFTKEFFKDDAIVIYSNQSRTVKPKNSLVTLSFGNVKRPQFSNNAFNDEFETVSNYESRMSVIVDLFSKGEPIEVDGNIISFENDAVDKLLSFVNFINSEYAIDWCHTNDVTILFDGEVQNLTGIINDTTYEFRSRLNILLYFTQRTIGTRADEV